MTRQPNAVEGKLRGKRRYGLGSIREKFAAMHSLSIARNILVMYLQKLLVLPFVILCFPLAILAPLFLRP